MEQLINCTYSDLTTHCRCFYILCKFMFWISLLLKFRIMKNIFYILILRSNQISKVFFLIWNLQYFIYLNNPTNPCQIWLIVGTVPLPPYTGLLAPKRSVVLQWPSSIAPAWVYWPRPATRILPTTFLASHSNPFPIFISKRDAYITCSDFGAAEGRALRSMHFPEDSRPVFIALQSRAASNVMSILRIGL